MPFLLTFLLITLTKGSFLIQEFFSLGLSLNLKQVVANNFLKLQTRQGVDSKWQKKKNLKVLWRNWKER